MKTNILPASWGRRRGVGGGGTSGVRDGRKLPLFFFPFFFFFFFLFFQTWQIVAKLYEE